MRRGRWEHSLGQVIPSCVSDPFNAFDSTSKDALQFSIWNAIQNLSYRFEKVDLVGDSLPDQRALYFSKQLEVWWRNMRRIKWMREPLQQLVPQNNFELSLSCRSVHSGLFVELTESPHQFRVDRILQGILRFGVLTCRGELRWAIWIMKCDSMQLGRTHSGGVPRFPLWHTLLTKGIRWRLDVCIWRLLSLFSFGSLESVREIRLVELSSSKCGIWMSWHIRCLGMNRGQFRPARCGESNSLLDTLSSTPTYWQFK
jgi:hypothetical protein